ncbi:MAG: 2-amino-4-hydroxy-6-hydroxymethyldihydropteridine diphosphokinase [Bacteroidales bacterium]|nr:2-amino-4-hydroxy-6-hydroxymethyldihydropteridine diphosphokinase [Bacteroidales bacterium]
MEIYLLLGGNIGPVRENLQRAQTLIGERVGQVTRVSRIYKSPAWGFESPDPFYNVALAVETALQPEETMRTLLQIEYELGRRRGAACGQAAADAAIAGSGAGADALAVDAGDGAAIADGAAAGHAAPSEKTYVSRPIDIDILFFGPLERHTPLLTVPHPRLPQRRFALTPLCDIAPDWVHPVLHETMASLLALCPDSSPVEVVV